MHSFYTEIQLKCVIRICLPEGHDFHMRCAFVFPFLINHKLDSAMSVKTGNGQGQRRRCRIWYPLGSGL